MRYRRVQMAASGVGAHPDTTMRYDAEAPGSPPSEAVLPWRLGSWHSYRWSFWFVGVFSYLAFPWELAGPGRLATVLTFNLSVGLVWAIPAWRMGVIVDDHGVRFTGVLWTRRFGWDRIVAAEVERYDLDPRLRLELTDGSEAWASGFRMPYHAAMRRDLWRDTAMFRAAELISQEAARRRQPPPPPDGVLVPTHRPVVRPTPVAAST